MQIYPESHYLNHLHYTEHSTFRVRVGLSDTGVVTQRLLEMPHRTLGGARMLGARIAARVACPCAVDTLLHPCMALPTPGRFHQRRLLQPAVLAFLLVALPCPAEQLQLE